MAAHTKIKIGLSALSVLFVSSIFAALFFAPSLWAASATIDVSVRGDGGVVVTMHGGFESCTYCDSKGEHCWTTDEGSVSLGPYLCSSSGHGSASCSKTLDRGTLHGTHVFKGSAYDCRGTDSETYTLILDNTPTVNIISPADASVVSAPFDIRGTATFKPTLQEIKGWIYLYSENWFTGKSKACTSENCLFSYQEITGKPYDFAHGIHTLKLQAVAVNVQASDQSRFTVDKTPTIKIATPLNGGVMSGPFDVRGTAVFKPTLEPVKGWIHLYLENSYSRKSKACTSENCLFSYEEITGKLYDPPHGFHNLKLQASATNVSVLDEAKYAVDKTPLVAVNSPVGVVSSPLDITGTVIFKPTLDATKGWISAYVDNGWNIGTKACLVETCTYSSKELTGRSYNAPAGNHKVTISANAMGVLVSDQKNFQVVPCNLRVEALSGDSDHIDPLVGGTLSFSGLLSDDSNRPLNWELNTAGRILQGEGKSVSATWDGKDALGKLVEPGSYGAILSAQTVEKTCSAKETKSIPITVESQPESPSLLACFGSSINIANGNLRHSQTLFPLPSSKLGGDFLLTYNSLDGWNGPLGTGWTHTYHIRLKRNNNDSYTLVEGDGRRISLYRNGSRYTPRSLTSPALTFNEDGTGSLQHQSGITYLFNPDGTLSRISDRNSNAIILSYDPEGNLIAITDPSGRNTVLEYHSNNVIKSLTDPHGNLHNFDYTNGDLTGISSQVQGLGVQKWAYTYYPHAFLWTKTDPGGKKTGYFYDDQHRVVKVFDPERRVREVAYDPANAQTRLVEKDGGVWVYNYDPTLGVLKKKTDPLNSTWSYAYYPDRNLESVQDPRGNRTSYTYDENGNVTSVEDALGHITRYNYNLFNKIQMIETDPGEPLIELSYDGNGNLTGVKDQVGVKTEYEYDSRGNLTGIKNPLEHIGLDYDLHNYLVRIRDVRSDLPLFEFGYDGAGNRTSIKEVQGAGGRMIRYEYNGLNQVTKKTGPAPELTETHYGYDLNGNVRRVTDGNGNATEYAYNYLGQVTKMKDALGYETLFSYGTGCPSCGAGVDKLTALTDPKKQTTNFEYDRAGNLTKEIDPLGYLKSYTHDPSGNLRSRTDANGNTTSYTFDELNRLREIQYADGSTVAFTYDARGNLKTAANSNIAYELTYDFNNRLTGIWDSQGKSTGYEYNALGNRVRMVTPDKKNISYNYDESNHLSRIFVNGGPSFDLVHDAYGRRMSLTYPNGVTTKYEYSPLGALTGIQAQGSRGLVNSFAYSHDAVGNRKIKKDISGEHRYDYDNVYQITRALHPGSQEEIFSYDPVGNRIPARADLDNALLEDEEYTYAYDYNGNLIEKASKGTGEKTQYFYEWENRLIKVESPEMTAKYKYDPFGRRIEKEVNGKITRYAYDGPNIILEESGDGIILSKYIHTLTIDDPLALEKEGQTFYYHKDGLGSIVSLTNQAGQVIQTYEYDSFGKILSQTGIAHQPVHLHRPGV